MDGARARAAVRAINCGTVRFTHPHPPTHGKAEEKHQREGEQDEDGKKKKKKKKKRKNKNQRCQLASVSPPPSSHTPSAVPLFSVTPKSIITIIVIREENNFWCDPAPRHSSVDALGGAVAVGRFGCRVWAFNTKKQTAASRAQQVKQHENEGRGSATSRSSRSYRTKGGGEGRGGSEGCGCDSGESEVGGGE